jgi:hypothetical protein
MNINNTKDLDDAIALLKTKQKNDAASLKNNFNELLESIKLKNIIKSAFKNATEGSSAGGLLLKAAAGIGGSLLNNNVKVGKGSSIIGIATNTLKSGMAGTVLKNADKIIAWGTAIFNSFTNKKNNAMEKNTHYVNMIDERVKGDSAEKPSSENLITIKNSIALPKTIETDKERAYKEGLFNNSDTEKV